MDGYKKEHSYTLPKQFLLMNLNRPIFQKNKSTTANIYTKEKRTWSYLILTIISRYQFIHIELTHIKKRN